VTAARGTPGPLKLGRSRDGYKVIVSDARTRTVAQFYRPERAEDAQLFVAASDLLAALKGLVGPDGDLFSNDAHAAARAAIEKAEGGAK
jgi:hypothetical protein